MSKSNFAEVETLKYLLTNGAMGTRPTAWFVSLHTADPTDAGGSEVTGAGYTNYARVAVTFAAPTSVDSGPSTTTNTTAVTFPALTGTGVSFSHYGIYSASTGGNLLYKGALGLPKTLAATEVASFAIGEILVTEE